MIVIFGNRYANGLDIDLLGGVKMSSWTPEYVIMVCNDILTSLLVMANEIDVSHLEKLQSDGRPLRSRKGTYD